jgi:hypothetical protein
MTDRSQDMSKVYPFQKARSCACSSRRQEETPSPRSFPLALPLNSLGHSDVTITAAAAQRQSTFPLTTGSPLDFSNLPRTRPRRASLNTNDPQLMRLPPPRIQWCLRNVRSPPRVDLPLSQVPRPSSSTPVSTPERASPRACCSWPTLGPHDEAIGALVHDGARASQVAPCMCRPFAQNNMCVLRAARRALQDETSTSVLHLGRGKSGMFVAVENVMRMVAPSLCPTRSSYVT